MVFGAIGAFVFRLSTRLWSLPTFARSGSHAEMRSEKQRAMYKVTPAILPQTQAVLRESPYTPLFKRFSPRSALLHITMLRRRTIIRHMIPPAKHQAQNVQRYVDALIKQRA